MVSASAYKISKKFIARNWESLILGYDSCTCIHAANVERTTTSNIFESKGNVGAMLNVSLNQFQFVLTRFQHFKNFRQC